MVFDTSEHTPSLEGKVIIVTGSTSGLGFEHLRYLANGHPSKLYLAARNSAKATDAISRIKQSAPDANIVFLELDLNSLDSVKRAAQEFCRTNSRLDILVNNAGIMAHPANITNDGYEIQFGVNYMGPYLFTRELLPLMISTARSDSNVRILNISSNGHKMVPMGGFAPDTVKTNMATYSTWTRYGQSKLANILFTTELARRYPQITSVSINPGLVQTNLTSELRKSHPWLDYFVLTPLFALVLTSVEKGVKTQSWASVAPVANLDLSSSTDERCIAQGEYYEPTGKIGLRSKEAHNSELARTLWEWTEEELESKGYCTHP